MEVKAILCVAILCVLSVFVLFGCSSLTIYSYEAEREFEEEDQETYEKFYDEQQRKGMGSLVISNSTSFTVYVVIDYKDRVKVRPGRLVNSILC